METLIDCDDDHLEMIVEVELVQFVVGHVSDKVATLSEFAHPDTFWIDLLHEMGEKRDVDLVEKWNFFVVVLFFS